MDTKNDFEINMDPSVHVIIPTDNMDQLDSDYEQFCSLPVDRMRMSDSIALQLYGVTNTDLYNIIKYKDSKHIEKIVDESFIFPKDDTIEQFKQKLNKIDDEIKNPTPEVLEAIEIAKSMEDITTVIIYPNTFKSMYSLSDLEGMYNRFNNLSMSLQDVSNNFSTILFGQDVNNMYKIEKNKLLRLQDLINFDPQYIGGIRENIKKMNIDYDIYKIDTYADSVHFLMNENTDLLSLYKKKIELYNREMNGQLYESVVSRTISTELDDAIIRNTKISSMVPEVTPYLIPQEIIDLLPDGLSNIDQEIILDYENQLACGLKNFNSQAYRKTIQELYSKLQSESDPYNIYKIENKLIINGWNPHVEPTIENFKYARERIIRYMDENYRVYISDISKYKPLKEGFKDFQSLQPIYIILTYTGSWIGHAIKFFDNSKYSHASISFSEKLDTMYSYQSEGLVYENLKDYLKENKDSICKVICTFVNQIQFNKIQEALRYYMQNKEKTRYALENLFRILFSIKYDDNLNLSMICSSFCNQLLRYANIDLVNNKNNNLVTPKDFDLAKSPKLFKVFEGKVSSYHPSVIKNRINALLNKDNEGYLATIFSLKEITNLIFESHELGRLHTMKSTDSVINEMLNDLKFLITPESILVEAKKFPLTVGRDGVIIDLPINIEEQYQEAHKLLLDYKSHGEIDLIKHELARLWYLNLLIDRKIRRRKDNESVKKLRDTRARIMNDFKTYLKYVLQKEPKFDFAEYFDKSQYNDRKVFIDKDTLIYSGAAIASIVKKLITK